MNELKFPRHINLLIKHNPHASNYETVKQYLAWIEDSQEGTAEFKNQESREKAIETNDLWVIQWYPNTPVGFNTLYAPTYQELAELWEKEK